MAAIAINNFATIAADLSTNRVRITNRIVQIKSNEVNIKFKLEFANGDDFRLKNRLKSSR